MIWTPLKWRPLIENQLICLGKMRLELCPKYEHTSKYRRRFFREGGGTRDHPAFFGTFVLVRFCFKEWGLWVSSAGVLGGPSLDGVCLSHIFLYIGVSRICLYGGSVFKQLVPISPGGNDTDLTM